MTQSVKRVLREPLLHFVILGAVLFGAYRLVATPGSSDRGGEITVSQGQIDNLITGFTKAWRRPPTHDELAGLVRDHIREEIYCREAVALGLDQDDTVIRRRLRQKMEFISEDIAARAESSEADLAAYLRAHPQSFRTESRFTFRQVYLNRDKRGAAVMGDAARILEQLQRQGNRADVSAVGDASLLDSDYSDVTASEVSAQFGPRFLEALQHLETGRWQGPAESGYGVHLVLVTARTDGRLPELAEVRDAVRRELENSRRIEANEAFYRELLKRYRVTIEGVEGSPKKIAQAK